MTRTWLSYRFGRETQRDILMWDTKINMKEREGECVLEKRLEGGEKKRGVYSKNRESQKRITSFTRPEMSEKIIFTIIFSFQKCSFIPSPTLSLSSPLLPPTSPFLSLSPYLPMYLSLSYTLVKFFKVSWPD